MLKETPKSLRLYFALVAGMSLLPMSTAIVRGQFSDLVSWSTLLNVAFSVCFVYIVIRFERLLRNPTPIKVVLIVSMALGVISFVVSLQSGLQTRQVGSFILAMLIFVYLMRSVTRLSNEVSSGIVSPKTLARFPD